MIRAMLDGDIVIDHLRGMAAARDELARHPDAAIAILSWMKILSDAPAPAVEATKAFLARFAVLPITEAVAARALILRRDHALRLPDALTWATAQVDRRLFVTRDAAIYPRDDPGIRIPYTG